MNRDVEDFVHNLTKRIFRSRLLTILDNSLISYIKIPVPVENDLKFYDPVIKTFANGFNDQINFFSDNFNSCR